MRARARLAVLGAAVVSVIAVPLVGVALHWSVARDGSLIVTTVSALGTAVVFVVSVMTYRWASAAEDRVQRLVGQSQATADEVTLRHLPPLDDRSAKSYLGYLLVRELATIERRGQALLGEVGTVSIIRVREGLRRANVWSEQDIADFDRALRLRNEVAHGDVGTLNVKDLEDAYSTMQRLRVALDHHAAIAGQ